MCSTFAFRSLLVLFIICAFFVAAYVHVPQFPKLNLSNENCRSCVHIRESVLAQSLVKAMSMLNIKQVQKSSKS
jgi:hypothetical protein